MSQLQKSLQSIETGRYLLTWLVSRADIFFFAYRCLDFVTSAHEPLERTSLILESLLPEFAHEAAENDPTVVEHRTDRVFRSMRPSDLILDLIQVMKLQVIMADIQRNL